MPARLHKTPLFEPGLCLFCLTSNHNNEFVARFHSTHHTRHIDQCQTHQWVVDASIAYLTLLAIIQETNDQIITPIVQALNVSLVFYKDVFKIKQKLDMGVLLLDANNSVGMVK